jgi:hypothetical protein
LCSFEDFAGSAAALDLFGHRTVLSKKLLEGSGAIPGLIRVIEVMAPPGDPQNAPDIFCRYAPNVYFLICTFYYVSNETSTQLCARQIRTSCMIGQDWAGKGTTHHSSRQELMMQGILQVHHRPRRGSLWESGLERPDRQGRW